MNHSTHIKKVGAVGLICCFLASLTPGFIASGSSTVTDKITAVSVLSGDWSSTSCYAKNRGMDNCLAISNIRIPASTPFTYEADISVESGSAGALAFGIADDGSSYSCLNVDKSANLSVVFGQYGSFEKPLSEAQRGQTTCHLKLVLDSSMKLSYSVDGEEVGSIQTESGVAGYLGLNTYYANALFENVVYALDGESKPVTGLSGHTGSWSNAFTGNNRSSENCIAMSAVSIPADTSFTYEADVHISDGLAASLVFGTGSDGSGLSAACVDRGSNLAHVFGQYGSFNQPLASGQESQFSYHMKVEYADGTLRYYLDGSLVGSLDNVSIREGLLGLCTYLAKATFYNIQYSTETDEPEEPPTKPDLPEEGLAPVTGWSAVSGVWNEADGVIQAENRNMENCIFRSGVHIPANTAFLYEADVTVQDGCAGALVFGYQNEGSWSAASYDISARLAHVFGLYGSFNKELTTQQLSVSTHRLKLYLDTTMKLSYYVDDRLVGATQLSSFDGGYLGPNTYLANVTFSNVQYTILEAPKLTGLSFTEGAFYEKFEPGRLSYTAKVDTSVSAISLTAGTESGTTLEINGFPAENGVPFSVPLEKGENTISVKLTDRNGVTNTVTITIIQVDRTQQYTDTYRPQLHYTAEANWINDPNGLVYDASTGLYHLYYQYSHSVNAGVRTSWGHATSTDLMHWTEMPVAILPDSLGLIWSGSCVIDRNNTSGLFDDSTAPDSRIVALYSYDRQYQALAYATDGGVSFIKYEGNPVSPNPDRQYGVDFRDPKVVWIEDTVYENGGIWLMIVGCAPYRLFTSPDLIHWTYNSDIQPKDGSKFGGECPDLFPLAVDGNENNIKWVMCAGGLKYIIGDLIREDGVFRFVAQSDILQPLNGNMGTVYASQTFYNAPQGRRIMVSWLRDTHNPNYEDKKWTGAQSIPYELKLVTVNGQIQLTTAPVSELDNLRSETPVFELSDFLINPDSKNILEGVEGTVFDLEAVINLNDADGFTFHVRDSGGEYTEVSYSRLTRQLQVKNTRAGLNPTANTMRLLPMEGNRIKIRIILDNSIIDVFGNDGEAAITSYLFSQNNGKALSFSADGSPLKLESLRIYELSSIWKNSYDMSVKTPSVLPTSPSSPSSTETTDSSEITSSSKTDSSTDTTIPAETDSSSQATAGSPATGHKGALFPAIGAFLLSLMGALCLKKRRRMLNP